MSGVPARLVEGTQIHSVFAALSELPGIPMTTEELSVETGLSIKHCSGYMYTLRKMGMAKSRPGSREGRGGPRYEHWAGDLL